jgi:hypothetical protein
MPGPTLRLEADISFRSVSADGSTGPAGSVTADGSTLYVALSGPFTAAAPPRPFIRQVASALAKRRLRLVVSSPSGVVAALGDVRAPWWQRLVTGSPYVRMGRLREVRRALGRRRSGGLPIAVPPTTPIPFFPTVSSLGPRPVTTTHDPRGGGAPRVVFALSPWPRAGEVQRVEYLSRTRTTFGSAPECDVRVEGLEPLHAVIERTEHDEYVLTHVGAVGSSAVAGIPAERSLLRTGAGIALGPVRLTYFREEYADHGRPYGGRLGGEIDDQRPQPTPRPRRSGTPGRPRTNRDPGQYF